ncbi:hypothetical protein K440DRAFT_642936 [Wilcoxina mikolae CBS 423.85]|nr:hypothetical protein K440DRAFT_642936 [Wilcoxina mikolae CBS 423.85]
MVSFKLLLVSVAALSSVTSASYGHHNMHRRMINKRANSGYGHNDTISMPTGTGIGTGVPDYTVEPTTFMTESTKYVTVTYTLGNGRVITKTITKTVEYETTTYETHHTPTIVPEEEKTTTVYQILPTPGSPEEETTTVYQIVAPTFVPVVPESDKTTRTCTRTVTVTVPYEEPESSPPAIAPEEAHGTVTVTDYTTSTTVVVVTSTITPTYNVSSIQAGPPYGNFTVSKYVKDDKTTTTTLYTTDTTTVTHPVGPTGTGGMSYYK